ncbi:MAG: hypothetical protein RBR33_05810 [Sulfurovaceae bacterium]|nr:hypothetical protein [Sulfurovaceae bacterium]
MSSNTKLVSESIHINAPEPSYKIAWEAWYLNSTKNNIQLFRKIPNMMSENLKVSVRFIKQSNYQDHKMFFDKNFDFEKWGKEVLIRPNVVANMKERGVKYSKKYVDYIGGLRCTTDAESSSPALGVGFKKYYTVCGYYDTNGNKKRVDIMYHYISSFGGTKFQSDTTSTVASSKDIEVLFKQDMKAIFDSLVIHDMDRTRMQKAGLLHDRAYDVNSEYK